MPERSIPSDVLVLLQERLAGLDELEALLLVRREAPRGLTRSEVAARLGLPASSSDAALERLRASTLLVLDADEGEGGRYAYRPGTTELEATVSSLAGIYDERRLEVMRILSNRALDRIRSAAARTFADAFLIGRNGSRGAKEGSEGGGGDG